MILKYYSINLDFKLNIYISGINTTPLVFALFNDQELAKILILNGANPNYPSDFRHLPAYKPGDPYFLEKAEDYFRILDLFKPKGLLPVIVSLKEALDRRDYSQAEQLLEQYPELKDPDTYAYFYCTQNLYPVIRYLDKMDEETLTFLFEHDFYPHYSEFLSEICGEYSIERISAVSWAVKNGNITALQLLLSRKFQNYVKYITPVITWDDLFFAAEHGYTEMLQIFKEFGVPLTTKIYSNFYSIDSADENIYTLLHIAVGNENFSTVKFLIEEGCDINALRLDIFYGYENTNISFSTVLDHAKSDFMRDFLTSKGALSFKEVYSNAKKYKQLIEQWNLPTLTVKCDTELYLLPITNPNKAYRCLNYMTFYVLGTLNDRQGLLVMDEFFNVCELVNTKTNEDSDIIQGFSPSNYGSLDKNGWYFINMEPIVFTFPE